uniref:Uncharacterized protein n=1 Tax=Rhizophora mucronata TaxID=61149 RepID=A0A2P2J738_RHIMU
MTKAQNLAVSRCRRHHYHHCHRPLRLRSQRNSSTLFRFSLSSASLSFISPPTLPPNLIWFSLMDSRSYLQST